jgi:hypothetical protein
MVSTVFKTPHGLIIELLSENRYPELEIPPELIGSSNETGYNEKTAVEVEKPDLE